MARSTWDLVSNETIQENVPDDSGGIMRAAYCCPSLRYSCCLDYTVLVHNSLVGEVDDRQSKIVDGHQSSSTLLGYRL